METPARDHDLVLYGATGFVGELIAGHLADHAPADLRVGLAGRSREKLEAVRSRLPAGARGWTLIEADSSDPDSLASLAASTRVLFTTVGPYVKHGLPVVEACARAGTHYGDLTGEVSFVRDAIDRFDALARSSGARIVHACGYDSIPSDLAVLLLHQAAEADGAGGLTDVRLVATARGGISGGTIDSMRGQLDGMRSDDTLRALARDPYSLSPDHTREPSTRQPSDVARVRRSEDGHWTGPFIMASANTRIVRRSNALQNWAYGRSFRYGEAMGAARGPKGAVIAGATALGLGAFMGAMALPPLRRVLDRALPAPGSGPSEKTRRTGWFRSEVTASTEGGRRYRSVAAGPGDPGYAATAVMAGETALALALDGDRLPPRSGSLTPATALGDVLVERLRAAGHTYEVSRLD
ncbi:enoyl-ACP reductase [Arthrobacter agilis]|uniref:saccharopine dehydrogenase family protein n=1 Tax=Arthrobacter agilis TaxID=37921 RepID=UPI000B35F585|nr:saccharopine dehydrogenase NADP-binding domain-containing protein [Arthrobacter agilis]OUM43687.1 enoyl-ACP reductase [Arthrobacter agilis]PPB46726.1 enoyl-ACP reductase [Arthrobacter agilis]TPV24932.1 enoyl-ACP reductase [Arthrobacter agilis]VDR31101.1 Putative trans-acting enoyl reductase Rv2449c [Arthrobacter agilis]